MSVAVSACKPGPLEGRGADSKVRSVPLPAGGIRREHTDLLGRVIRHEEPDGSWLRYQHGADGALTGVEHSSGERVDYAFSRERLELRAASGSSETTIRLSSDGYPCEIRLATGGFEWTMRYRRDAAGNVLASQYPSGAWLENADGNGGHQLRCGSHVYCTLTSDEATGATRLEFSNGTRTEELVEAPATGAEETAHRLMQVCIHDATGLPAANVAYGYGDGGRVSHAGSQRYTYDSEGRLSSYAEGGSGQAKQFRYDAGGRLIRKAACRLKYERAPMVSAVVGEEGRVEFAYDSLGRRVERRDLGGTTRYSYNLFSQLRRVEFPDGRWIDYLYDGFGRLISRKTASETRFYVTGFDGNRLAEMDERGAVVCTYLWARHQCIARVAGPLGGVLDASYHRLHGGRLIAIGNRSGQLTLIEIGDPFGCDQPVDEHCPVFASLFGDRETGLLYAGHRWLDCSVAQFLTPDSWFANEPGRSVPPSLQPVLSLIPGGLGRLLTPVTAYCWCVYDPVNFVDVNGHNWLGLIFSGLSALLWEAQLNGLALELHAINIIIDILQLVIGRAFWDTDGYWLTSVFHFAPPVASYRLMVPLGLVLNGISTRDGRAWALGNVIFSRTKDLTDIEDKAERDLLVCSNAGDYVAFANEAAANKFLGRNPLTRLTGSITAVGSAPTGATIGSIVVATPGGASLGSVLAIGDFVSIRVSGAPADEIRSIASLPPGAQITLNVPPLPATFAGQAVEMARLDQSILRIDKDSARIARAVQFIRGQAIHYGTQIPDGFPTSGLSVTEFLQAGVKKTANATLAAEAIILRMGEASDLTGYSAGDFIRVLVGGAFIARKVESTQAPADVVIDAPLPGTNFAGIQVVKMTASGSAVAGRSVPSDSAGSPIPDRITAGALTDLRELDGLSIADSSPTPVVLRRIAADLFLDCEVDALPAGLQNAAMQVERLGPDLATQATGIMLAVATLVQLNPGQTATFSAGQPVSVKRQSDGLEAFGVLASATGAGLLTLDAPLPAPFTVATDVTVTLLSAAGGAADAVSGSPAATHVVATVVLPTDFGVNDVVRIRPSGASSGGAVRKLNVAPAVVARLDSSLPNTHFTNVTVQRFVADTSTQRDNVNAPIVQQRLTIAGATNPFVAGDQLYIAGTEQGWAQVDHVQGQDVFLAASIAQPMGGSVKVTAVAPSGVTTPDGKLDEGRVLIPSDPGEDPLTRRGAVENHEMRHVWQGAVWGPFLLGLPIPWLANLGFSFTRFANTSSKVFRWASVGAIDGIVAALIWGIGSRKFGTDIQGALAGAERKSVKIGSEVAGDQLERFKGGSQIEVTLNDVASYNLVDSLDTDARLINVRFAIGDADTGPEAPVKLGISPFENIRRKVSQICSANLETIWHDHIPTAWGRALSAVAQRDSWLPPFGIYPMSLWAAGGDQDRIPNEQDAAYHSGDLYTDISTSDPTTIFVGQFSKLFAFIKARYGGLSSRNAVSILTVAVPTGVQAGDVAGGVPAGTLTLPSGVTASDVLSTFPLGADLVSFRENYFVQLSDKIENAVGAFFVTSKPGVYTVVPPDKLLIAKGVVFKFAFDVDFANTSRLTVNDIGVAPDPAAQYFETQQITFTITGDPSAQYQLRFPPGSTGNVGLVSGLFYTAPLLAAGAPQVLEVTATYSESHPVFTTAGQSAKPRLTPEQRTNLCKQLTLSINPLTAPTLGPIAAGDTADFTMPIAPNGNPTVTSPLPAGAAVNARVINLGGTPAQLRLFAPNAVSAPTDVTFDMVFGSGAVTKTVTATVQVTP